MAELLVTVAVIGIAAGGAAIVAGPMLAREGARSDLYALQSALQTGRVEAVSRNRVCRVLINSGDRRVLIVDGMGTTSTADDVVVRRTSLSSRSSFTSPDGSSALTISNVSGSWYGVDFATDGTVQTGTGQIALRGGDRFGRVSVYAGGGAQVAFWNGSRWKESGG